MTATATQPRTHEQQLGKSILDEASVIREQLTGLAGYIELLVRTHEADRELVNTLSDKLVKVHGDYRSRPYPSNIGESIADAGEKSQTGIAGQSLIRCVTEFLQRVETLAEELAKGSAK